MFFRGVLADDCSVERLFGRFCPGGLPELELGCRFDDFVGIHRHFGKPQDFDCRFKQAPFGRRGNDAQYFNDLFRI